MVFFFFLDTIKYRFFLLDLNFIFYKFCFMFNSIFTFSDEILLICLIYNFVKLIIFNSIIELIWPTNYFNKKHNINFSLIKFRGFTETILKLRLKNFKNDFFYKIFLCYFFFKKKLKK